MKAFENVEAMEAGSNDQWVNPGRVHDKNRWSRTGLRVKTQFGGAGDPLFLIVKFK